MTETVPHILIVAAACLLVVGVLLSGVIAFRQQLHETRMKNLEYKKQLKELEGDTTSDVEGEYAEYVRKRRDAE